MNNNAAYGMEQGKGPIGSLPLPFAAALVLGADAPLRGVDRYALRTSGIRLVTALGSGREAVRLLASTGSEAPSYDLVLCDEHLADMSLVDFMRCLHEADLLGRVPVVALSRSATREGVLAAIGAGCSGFLARPYTVLALEAQLQHVRTVFSCGPARLLAQAYKLLAGQDGQTDGQAEAHFVQSVQDVEDAARAAFAEGAEYLTAGQWDKAIEAFSLSMRCQAVEADACMGMAAAWHGKGNAEKSREYLRRAGELYVKARQWNEARQAFARLLAQSPAGSPNPLLLESVRLIRSGDIDHAAQALIGAYELPNTETVNIHHIARASQFTRAPEETLAALCDAIGGHGKDELAERLRHRLVGDFGSTDKEAEPRRAGLFANYPMLHDAIMVARFTARCWSQVA